MSIGENISAIRKNARLTIKDTSIMSGVAPSIISMIENDKANPSLSTLMAIAKVLGTDVSTFFDSPSAPAVSPLTRVCDRNLIGTAHGWTSSTIANSPENHISICHSTLAVDAIEKSTDEGQLFSPLKSGIEFAYLLSGKVRLELGDDIFVMNPGDIIHYENTARRRVANISNGPSEILWITVGE